MLGLLTGMCPGNLVGEIVLNMVLLCNLRTEKGKLRKTKPQIKIIWPILKTNKLSQRFGFNWEIGLG